MTRTPYKIQKINAPLCQLGEGLCWDTARNLIWWLDIEGMKIYNMNPDTHHVNTFDTDAIIGCLILDANNRLIAYNDLEVQIYDDTHNTFTKLSDGFNDGFDDVLANDGKTDRQGRLLLGTKHTTCTLPTAGVQSIDSLHSIHHKRPLITHITVANGPAFSPDGTTMYFADSPTGIVSAYDYNTDNGTLSNKRVFATTPTDTYPDGMTVDKDGGIWQALWNGKRILRYAPNGDVIDTIQIPNVLHVTNVCFGGADMQTLFITTAYSGMSHTDRDIYPDSGAVFRVHIPHTHGIPETPCNIKDM